MKALGIAIAVLLTGSAAAAQPASEPAMPRADVQGTLGWQNLRAEPTESRNDWINSIAFADAAAGWYWTEHLRAQIDVGVGSTARSTRFVAQPASSRSNFQTIETDVRPTTFAISQQYQFFHNAVFHPHVGAGVLVRSERLHEEFSSVVSFNPATGQNVVIEPPHTEDATRTRVAVLADAGFKAYVSERAFVVTDARFTIRQRVDGVLFRFGFGLDF